MSFANLNAENTRDSFDSFLSSHKPPTNLGKAKSDLSEFISQTKKNSRRIVLVTSGGTTAPIEERTVRFLDNFSTGKRGAASAEYFLEEGYDVIFLYREGSLYPYSRNFTPRSILDLFQLHSRTITVNENQKPILQEFLEKRDKYQSNLCSISFVTISDYLFLLQECILQLSSLKEMALLYLAAAASDYYIPPFLQAKDKLHSGGILKLEFHPVPKVLHFVKSSWAPSAFMVTFKLETDPDQLVHRAQAALSQYQHELVIGNLLSTRHQQVYFVTLSDLTSFQLAPNQHADLEHLFIPELVRLHGLAIQSDPSVALA